MEHRLFAVKTLSQNSCTRAHLSIEQWLLDEHLFLIMVCMTSAMQRLPCNRGDEAHLEVGHSPVAEVYRIVRIGLDCPRVTSNCTVKVSMLERFIGLGFELLCLRGVPCAFAATWTCTVT